MADWLRLDDRAVLALGGEDARSFLQGLITNDVDRLTPEAALHAALLTPQGKYLFDFFVIDAADGLLIDAAADRLEALKKRLSMYKLRAKVTIDDRPDLAVFAILGADATVAAGRIAGALAFADPRLSGLGAARRAAGRGDRAGHVRRARRGDARGLRRPAASRWAFRTAFRTWSPRNPSCWRTASRR